jgi:two-component system chemotaxis response regulator CheB
MPGHDIIVIGTSAGGLSALIDVFSSLPANFATSLVVVQHMDPRHRSLLAEILGRRTGLRVKQAEDGESMEQGTAYIAPPDRHLLVN